MVFFNSYFPTVQEVAEVKDCSKENKTWFEIRNFHGQVMSVRPIFRIYFLEDYFTNPRKEWIRVGRPTRPNPEQIRKIRNSAKWRQTSLAKFPMNGKVQLQIRPNSYSVILIHICLSEEILLSDQPFKIEFYEEKWTKNLLLMWKYPTGPHCLDTFIIEWSHNGLFDTFQVLEETKSVNNFHYLTHIRDGWYRIRARNYWNVFGPYSIPVYFRSE